MKKFILSLFIMSIIAVGAKAQCDNPIVLKSSKTEYLDKDGKLENTVTEDTKIDINKKTITVAPGSDHTMTGDISSITCEWKTPFKEGKMLIKASFEDNGETKIMNFTIEGKDGKVSFLAEFQDDPSKKIRVWADSFEAAK